MIVFRFGESYHRGVGCYLIPRHVLEERLNGKTAIELARSVRVDSMDVQFGTDWSTLRQWMERKGFKAIQHMMFSMRMFPTFCEAFSAAGVNIVETIVVWRNPVTNEFKYE